MSASIINIKRRGYFTLAEALELLSLVKKITKESYKKIEPLFLKLKNLSDSKQQKEIETIIDHELKSWNQKITKIGATPKGLWIVDFDSEDGYFCWKYGESTISYWHPYEGGYTSRIPIEEWLLKKEASTQFNLFDSKELSHNETGVDPSS